MRCMVNGNTTQPGTPNRVLKAARVLRDLSQRDLALRAGISHNRYWEIENGYREASSEERAALAAVLDTCADELFAAA